MPRAWRSGIHSAMALTAAGTLVAGAVGLSSQIGVGHSVADFSPSPGPALLSPIRHVVIIDQENRSFDNVLGFYCTSAHLNRAPCDGAILGTLKDGTVVPLTPAPDLFKPILAHNVAAQRKAIDDGLMDGFSTIRGCRADTSPPYACYSSFDPSRIPNVVALATAFTLSDRTFEFRSTPSWAGHMVLGSATLDGFEGDNPTASAFTSNRGPGWGCDSFKDALWRSGRKYVAQPSCIPNANGAGPYRRSPVPYVPTIFDRLDAAGLSWKIYGGEGPRASGGYGWTICPTFYECLGSSQHQNQVAASQMLTDAANGNLPAYSVVTPVVGNSQHPPMSMAQGDNWIGSVVDAIENGPEWGSTAIFLTWDDCGCFYDHVNPLQYGATGVRVPMIIVSPYARPGYTDSTTATFLSMLAFVENTFGLPPLNGHDSRAYDFRGSFDFTQQPLHPVPMVTNRVPAGELVWLARHPPDADDPT
jgi:phospholipase C